MRAGLAGYARSGKTTLFNALTGLHRGPEAKLHMGAIKVPDPRLDKLSAMFKPRKTTPAEVVIADLPGPREPAARFAGGAARSGGALPGAARLRVRRGPAA